MSAAEQAEIKAAFDQGKTIQWWEKHALWQSFIPGETPRWEPSRPYRVKPYSALAAAAQADFDARIRSALVAYPVPALEARWDQIGPMPTDPDLEERLSRIKHDDDDLPVHPTLAAAVSEAVNCLVDAFDDVDMDAVEADLKAMEERRASAPVPALGEVGELVAKLGRVGSEVLGIPINPDGPEAASFIAAQAAELERLRRGRDQWERDRRGMLARVTQYNSHTQQRKIDALTIRAEAAESSLALAKAEIAEISRWCFLGARSSDIRRAVAGLDRLRALLEEPK